MLLLAPNLRCESHSVSTMQAAMILRALGIWVNLPACLHDMPHAANWSHKSLWSGTGRSECSSLRRLSVLTINAFLGRERPSDAIHLLMSSALLETGKDWPRGLMPALEEGGRKDVMNTG